MVQSIPPSMRQKRISKDKGIYLFFIGAGKQQIVVSVLGSSKLLYTHMTNTHGQMPVDDCEVNTLQNIA